jgi:hypothetical protein
MTKDGNVLHMPGVKELPASTPKTMRSVMDTLLVTPAGLDRWKIPPFQREKRITVKVKELSDTIRGDDGVIPGIITLGKLQGATFLVDGQHRIEAFRMTGLAEGYADVRIMHFESMGEMADEFVTLNSPLVRMRNDDILRGLEATNEYLAAIRKKCPFVGYAHIRSGGKIVLSMAPTIRSWFGSALPTPTAGPSSSDAAKMLTEVETKRICHALSICHEAWGADPNNYRLWGTLNLAIVFWLWRRVVLGEDAERSKGGPARATLTPDQFMRCLMSLAADSHYTAWLVGRSLRERDRSACYGHIKKRFQGRLRTDLGKHAILPQPSWGGKVSHVA